MGYKLLFTPTSEKQLKKLKQKDPVLFSRIKKKLEELLDNPLHFKPLQNKLKGCRRIHFDPFVVVFEIEGETIIFHYIKHHDDAY